MTAEERKAFIKSLKGLSLEQLNKRHDEADTLEKQAIVLLQISQAYRKVCRKAKLAKSVT